MLKYVVYSDKIDSGISLTFLEDESDYPFGAIRNTKIPIIEKEQHNEL